MKETVVHTCRSHRQLFACSMCVRRRTGSRFTNSGSQKRIASQSRFKFENLCCKKWPWDGFLEVSVRSPQATEEGSFVLMRSGPISRNQPQTLVRTARSNGYQMCALRVTPGMAILLCFVFLILYIGWTFMDNPCTFFVIQWLQNFILRLHVALKFQVQRNELHDCLH